MEVGLRVYYLETDLVLLYCFNPCFNGSWSESITFKSTYITLHRVSILVLMEVGLREPIHQPLLLLHVCFNPCFNGSWSESELAKVFSLLLSIVSILVLMEVGLRGFLWCQCNKGYTMFQSLF